MTKDDIRKTKAKKCGKKATGWKMKNGRCMKEDRRCRKDKECMTE